MRIQSLVKHLRRSALFLAVNYSLYIVHFTFWQGSGYASVEDSATYDGNCKDFKTAGNKNKMLTRML